METRKSWAGPVLFVCYLMLYSGFVLANAFVPEIMEKTPLSGPLSGINLAILYGVGLILAALVLSLLYGFLRSPTQEQPRKQGGA